jgi:molecular chaperone GrpE
VRDENIKNKENENPGDELNRALEEASLAADNAAADAEVARLTADLQELRQTLMRRQADFENYRKRIEKERAEDQKRATARLIEGLIPVVDGFEHALAAHREAEYETYRRGFELIYKQLGDHLTRLGVERMDPTGKPFDPHLHQAMERRETSDYEDGTVVQVFQPGYVYHGRVLRPAMVSVATQPASASKNAVH